MATVAFDWVRPGIIPYGVSPLEDRSTGADFGCQPVMSLALQPDCRVSIKPENLLVAVEPVSERDTRLGVVAMGYGDGYPRAAPSGTPKCW